MRAQGATTGTNAERALERAAPSRAKTVRLAKSGLMMWAMNGKLIFVALLAALACAMGCHANREETAEGETPPVAAAPTHTTTNANSPSDRGSSAIAPQTGAQEEAPPTLGEGQQALLESWYKQVGPPQPKETLGELAVRAGLLQLGKPYFNPHEGGDGEKLYVALDSFQCVTFVESSLALARCIWQARTDARCFVTELEKFRYRGGELSDFSSRMHYFAEWIADNAQRGRLDDLTASLGGRPKPFAFFYVTRHANKYPPLADPPTLTAMQAVEARLDKTPTAIIGRDDIAAIEGQLQTGDVVAVVTNKPGLVISHTGFILRDRRGVAHLLHASSHHQRVLVTKASIASYIHHWPDRRGLKVARPLPPVVGTDPQASRSTKMLSP